MKIAAIAREHVYWSSNTNSLHLGSPFDATWWSSSHRFGARRRLSLRSIAWWSEVRSLDYGLNYVLNILVHEMWPTSTLMKSITIFMKNLLNQVANSASQKPNSCCCVSSSFWLQVCALWFTIDRYTNFAVPGMSIRGRDIVKEAQNFYIGVLTTLLRDTQLGASACCHRLSALLNLALVFEVGYNNFK